MGKIMIKNKKIYNELKNSAKEFHKGVSNDRRELEDFQDSNFLGSIVDGIFLVIVLILDGYFFMTEKLSWIILLVINVLILCVYYLYKKRKNDKEKPKILPER